LAFFSNISSARVTFCRIACPLTRRGRPVPF